MSITKNMTNPDTVGSSEYLAIYEYLKDLEESHEAFESILPLEDLAIESLRLIAEEAMRVVSLIRDGVI